VSSSSARRRPARWRWAVTGAFGLGGITISAWGPRLPAIKAGLGVGTATIGLLLAGVTVGTVLGLLAAPQLLHRLGGRRALAGAILLIAAAMTFMGLARPVNGRSRTGICLLPGLPRAPRRSLMPPGPDGGARP
jgi:MFS family permease